MRILIISDISWDARTLKTLKDKVVKTKASLVLLAGDLVNNGDYERAWTDLYDFMRILNKKRIKTFFVRGNWDEVQEYDDLVKMTATLPFVEEISGRVVEFQGIRVLGIPFSFTNDLKSVRGIRETFPEEVDIVVAHSESKRRIWLFGLKTKFIITGHFDQQLCQIRDKTFIATNIGSWVIVDYSTNQQIVLYRLGKQKARAKIRNGELIWMTAPFRDDLGEWRGRSGLLEWQKVLYNFLEFYPSCIEAMIVAKQQLEQDKSRRLEIADELLKKGVPRNQIEEYIGVYQKRSIRAGTWKI